MNTDTGSSFLRAVMPYAPALSHDQFPKHGFEVFRARLQQQLEWVTVEFFIHYVGKPLSWITVRDSRKWSEWYNNHSLRGPRPESLDYEVPADKLGEFLRRLAAGEDLEEGKYN